MKKRLIVFSIIISLCLPSMSSFARIPQDKIGDFLSHAELYSLSSSKDKYITRGEFAMMAAKITGIENAEALYDFTPFDDVTKDKEEFGAVALLYDMGIIKGDGHGEVFRTDDFITGDEAQALLVRLLGLEFYADFKGYYGVASSKGLFKGVNISNEGYIDFNSAQTMIYNALEADISESNTFDGYSNGISGESYMKKRLGIHKISGLVSDDGNISFYGSSNIRKNQIKIENTVFENTSGINAEAFFGCYVEAYYHTDRNSGEKNIFFLYTNESRTKILEIKAENIKKFSGNTYVYYISEESNYEKRVHISSDYRLIYNGALYTPSDVSEDFSLTTEEMLYPENGSVKLIDTDGDGGYETVIIKSYENIFVNSFDPKNLVIYGFLPVTPKKINLKEAEGNITYKTHLGVEAGENLIVKDAAVSVAKSADGKKAEVIVSTKKAEGSVYLASENEYSIGEEKYELTNEYNLYLNNASQIEQSAPKSGNNCTVYLTFDDKVLFAKVTKSDSMAYALLVKAVKASGLSNPSLVLLTDNNEYNAFELAPTVKMNERNYKDAAMVINYLTVQNDFTVNGSFGGLVGVKINKDNKVTYIDTPYDEDFGNPNSDIESENSLHRLKGCRTEGKNSLVCNYRYENYDFHNFFVGTGSTTTFYIPYNDDDIYRNAIATNLSDTTSVTVSGYADVIPFSMKAGSLKADVILSYRDTLYQTLRYGTEHYLITDVSRALGKDGDIVKRVSYTNGYMLYESDTKSEESLDCPCGCGRVAEKGDVVRLVTDGNKIIPDGGTFIHYDYSEKSVIAYSTEVKHGTIRIGSPSYYTNLGGYVNSVEDDMTMEYYADYSPFYDYYDFYRNVSDGFYNRSDKGTYNERLAFPIHACYYIEFDTEKGTWRNINLNEIKTYEDGNGLMEKSVIMLKNGTPYCLIVYR